MNFIAWEHIEWPPGRPDLAFYRCPHCGDAIDEVHKASMVNAGQWIAQRPEVQGHAGFLINSLVSQLKNASWGRLAEEFLTAKDDPSLLKPFVNTVLATGWTTSDDRIDESSLASRVEDFGLDRMHSDVLAITAGWICRTTAPSSRSSGTRKTGEIFILGHSVIWGDPADNTFWAGNRRGAPNTRWKHPLGSTIGVDVVGVNSGDADSGRARFIRFARPRQHRGVLAH